LALRISDNFHRRPAGPKPVRHHHFRADTAVQRPSGYVLDWSFEIFGEFPEGLRRISRNFAVYSAANSEMVKTQCPSGNTLFYYSALWFGFSGPPRSLAHGFAEEVAWNVEQGGTPFVRPCGIVKSLDGNLDDLVTRVHFDPDLSVAEFDLVAPTVFATDYRMGHLFSSIFQWVNPAVLAWTRTFVLPWRDIVVVPSQSRLDVWSAPTEWSSLNVSA
jgi:hypothetical protein